MQPCSRVGNNATIAVPGLEEPVEGKVILVVRRSILTAQPSKCGSRRKIQTDSEARIECPFVHGVRGCTRCISVPASALLTGSDGATTVMVIGDDQHAHQQAIKVGIRQADKVQITEGLKEGQRVVTEGAYGLPDKAKVSVEAPAEAEKEGDKPERGKEPDSKDSTKDEKP